MTTMNDELQHAIAERDAIVRKSVELAERAAKLSMAKSARDEAQVAVDELGRRETAALTEWASAGAQGAAPMADPKAREAALRKLAAASEAARAIDTALAALEQQNTVLAQELAGVQQRVRSATARHLAEQHRERMARQRQMEDSLEVERVVCAGIFQLTTSNDPKIADGASADREAERLAWIQNRVAANESQISAEWHKVTATLPGA